MASWGGAWCVGITPAACPLTYCLTCLCRSRDFNAASLSRDHSGCSSFSSSTDPYGHLFSARACKSAGAWLALNPGGRRAWRLPRLGQLQNMHDCSIRIDIFLSSILVSAHSRWLVAAKGRWEGRLGEALHTSFEAPSDGFDARVERRFLAGLVFPPLRGALQGPLHGKIAFVSDQQRSPMTLQPGTVMACRSKPIIPMQRPSARFFDVFSSFIIRNRSFPLLQLFDGSMSPKNDGAFQAFSSAR
jgi:hypothetical protein